MGKTTEHKIEWATAAGIGRLTGDSSAPPTQSATTTTKIQAATATTEATTIVIVVIRKVVLMIRAINIIEATISIMHEYIGINYRIRSTRAQAHAQRMWDRKDMVSVGDGGGVGMVGASVALCGGMRVAVAVGVGVGVRRSQGREQKGSANGLCQVAPLKGSAKGLL